MEKRISGESLSHWSKEDVLLSLDSILDFGKFEGESVRNVINTGGGAYIKWLSEKTHKKFTADVWRRYYAKSSTLNKLKPKQLVKRSPLYIEIAIGKWYEEHYDRWATHFAQEAHRKNKNKNERKIHEDVKNQMLEEWRLQ